MLFAVFLPTGVLAVISVVAQRRESEFLVTELRENGRLLAQALISRIEGAILAEEKRIRRDANIFCPDEADIDALNEFIELLKGQHPLVGEPALVSERGEVLYPKSPFSRDEELVPARPFDRDWSQEEIARRRKETEALLQVRRIMKGAVGVDESIEICRRVLDGLENEKIEAMARIQLAKSLLIKERKEEAASELRKVFSIPVSVTTELGDERIPAAVEARVLYLENIGGSKEELKKILKEAYRLSVEYPEYFSSYSAFQQLLYRIDGLLILLDVEKDEELKRLELKRERIKKTEERIARLLGDFMPIFRDYLKAPDNYSMRECHISREIGPMVQTFVYFVLAGRILIERRKERVVFVYALERRTLELIVSTAAEQLRIQPDMAIRVSLGYITVMTAGREESISSELLVASVKTPYPFPPITVEVYSANIRFLINWMFRRSLINFFLISVLVTVAGLGVLFLLRGIRREIELVQMRSQFVSSVTHELKTPLTSIRMLAETIQLGRMFETERLKEYMEVIAAESERLSRLITNVLDFARVEEGRKEYDFGKVDLCKVAKQSIAVFAYYVHYAGFRIEFSLPKEPVFVRGDSEALEQVTLNLLSNAIKYSDTEKLVEVRVMVEGKEGVIEIEDHGIGIPEDEIEEIFERFKRSSVTGASHRTGTGIGLSLVKSIVEAHNGFIEVDSEVGRGSIFRVLLPLYEEEGEDGKSADSGRRDADTDGDEGQPRDGGI